MTQTLQQHSDRLHQCIQAHGRMLVAYSGGVDSAYLAWSAYQTLGPNGMIAVLADSPSLSRKHLTQAVDFAQQHSIPLRIVKTNEMQREDYVRNDGARCFHCKDELFSVMEMVSAETGIGLVAYGRNRDDSGDYRPGQRAAELHHAIAPLAEAGLGKAEIRTLAQQAGLSVWDKPASACLSSRLEYGRPVTAEALRQVEEAEDFLASLGFRQMRVRHHGEMARIEIERGELEKVFSLAMLDRITAGVRAAGFLYVAIDTAGYRSGSMNAVLPVSVLFAAREENHAA